MRSEDFLELFLWTFYIYFVLTASIIVVGSFFVMMKYLLSNNSNAVLESKDGYQKKNN